MSESIKVRIPSRGVSVSFPSDATEEEIQSVLNSEYPRDGRDVAYDIQQDPTFVERMTKDDYLLMRRHEAAQPERRIPDIASQAVGQLADTFSKAGSELVGAMNLYAKPNPTVRDAFAPVEAIGRGIVGGLGQAGALGYRAIENVGNTLGGLDDPMLNTYSGYLASTGQKDTPEAKADWEAKTDQAFESFKNSARATTYANQPIQESPMPAVSDAVSYAVDVPGIAPAVAAARGATNVVARGVGGVTKGAGTLARVVTQPLAEMSERLAKSDNLAAQVTDKVLSPITATVRAGDDIARAAQVAGSNLADAPTRLGPLESLAAQPGAKRVDKALAAVGRYGADNIIMGSLAATTGAIEGATIGGVLGGLADGREGMISGAAVGGVQGGIGASLGQAYYKLSGDARIDAALADFNRFRSELDEPTRAKLDTVAERDGLDAVVRLMDGAGLLRGQFKDADVNFLSGEEFKAKYKGADARGVQIIEAAKPVIDINVDHKRSDYTFGHEIFHALEQVEQLRPQMERIKQEIVGAWVTNPDGTVTQAQAGFLSPAEVEIRHKQYMRKLAQSGASRDVRPWFEDKTIGQKARRVAGELGAEYMARLITGSDPDALLRGFDGITRQIADYTLTKASNETIRGIAERLGTGARPVESILFKDLKNAPPVVTAALRDVLRARKEMNKRIKLIDRSDRGLVLTPRDLSNPAAAEIAVRAGVAVKDPSGAVRMRTDDELTKLEDDQANAIRKIVDSTPIEDPTKPHMRSVDGNIYTEGGVSPEQLKAFLAEPTLTNKVKEALGFVAEGLSNLYSGKGATVFRVEYGPALTKKTHPITRKKRNAYSSGIRLTQRDIAIFGLKFNKGDVPYIKLLDVSKLMSFAADRASSGNLGPYGRDFDGFTTDIVQYFENASDPTSKTHTVDLPGMTPEKARFLNEFFGSKDGTDSVFIRDFRLDRITEIRPTNQRIAASELAWQRQKSYWMPAQKVGDGQVVKSTDGFSILNKGKNWHLYAPDGKRIGIYETQAKAEARAEVDSIPRIEPAKIDGGLVKAPESGLFRLTPEVAKNFQPASDKVKIEDFHDRPVIALASDRMGVGPAEVGPLSNRRQTTVASQGGRGFIKIFNGGGWAFSDEPTALRFLQRIGQVADSNGNAIAAVTVLSPINHLKNAAGQSAYIDALRAAIDGKLIRQKDADAHIKQIGKAIVRSTAQSVSNNTREKFANVRDLASFEAMVRGKNVNFADASPLLEQMQRKKLPITEKAAKEMNISPDQIARDIADPELADVPIGTVVALFEVNVNQRPDKNNFHYAYPYAVHGKNIGFLDKFYNLADLTTDKRILQNGRVSAQPIQTVMPLLDNIRNAAESGRGFASDPANRGEINFQPSTIEPRAIEDIAKQVGGGEIKGGAKRFGAFMWLMKKKGITPRDIVKAYTITLSSIQRGEQSAATIKKYWPDAPFADDEKVRPEDAFATLLGTKAGQEYLNDAEKGVFNRQAAEAMIGKFKSFGLQNKLLEALESAATGLHPKATEIISAVRGMPADNFADYVRQNFKGVSYGKVGFMSGMMGRGDLPTVDSRQKNLVYGRDVDVTKDRLLEQRDRLLKLGIKVPDRLKPFAQTLLHHEVWDRLNGSDTEHGPIKEAMLNFQPAQKLPHGNVWRGENGVSIVQRDGGKFRVYGPLGLLGVAASYEKAQQLANRRSR